MKMELEEAILPEEEQAAEEAAEKIPRTPLKKSRLLDRLPPNASASRKEACSKMPLRKVSEEVLLSMI